MNKFSRTARSVTFAAIVGLSLGVSAPGAFAETAGEIANRATKGQSTITQETVRLPFTSVQIKIQAMRRSPLAKLFLMRQVSL